MAQQKSSGGIPVWLITTLGLALVWGTIVTSLPSQQELTAVEPSHAAAALASPPPRPASAPTLDLTVPTSPPLSSSNPSSIQQERAQAQRSGADVAAETTIDPRSQQVTKLKCEAEIEQLCPASSDGFARRQCVEQRMHRLAPPCQHLLRERFVRWKEERIRMTTACQEDVKRFCASITPGSGNVLQCLQEHAQEVSDRCYQTLPKGTLYFTH